MKRVVNFAGGSGLIGGVYLHRAVLLCNSLGAECRVLHAALSRSLLARRFELFMHHRHLGFLVRLRRNQG